MSGLNMDRTRKLLQQFEFANLFTDELGWDHYREQMTIEVEGVSYLLDAFAEKRGLVAFLCSAPDGAGLPSYALRRKIERQTAKIHHEHLIIYVDQTKTRQVWQWVKREAGRPDACREHTFYKGQSGEALIQKLAKLVVTLDEEETISIVDMAGRARAAFNVEKITKKFYELFKKEHTTFLQFVNGITDMGEKQWYASLMLNRLMFVYFIQKKGFLDNDLDYLRNRLRMMQQEKGEGRFHSFYRHFLIRLFHEGLGKKKEERDPELDRMLGKIPYLNGGLFDVHELENKYHDIQISDDAFDRLFTFFEQYHWHLDERPLRQDNEINPDVLGYIFEKYINQKQMGAYYTKEDITEYISKNTIIPYLFDAARKKCKIAFEGEQSVWNLLQNDPDRYIYEAVRKGCELALPPEIEVGLDTGKPNLLERRKDWNKPAPEEFALPTEIWREVVARRQRYEEVRTKLAAGEVREINDCITYNLNIRQFAQDVIENCEGPELLRAFWRAIVGRIPKNPNEKQESGITILDPTCGSGAFLFAALNILEPLYEACLDRMQTFVADLAQSDDKRHPEKFSDFRSELARVEAHPNQSYFIMKSIILNNLYGVDIMAEAVEICKLRLFLKMVAQVERGDQIEPLPDIDFNIRCGNTLVGFATYDEVRKAVTTTGGKQLKFGVMYDDRMAKIEQKAQDLQQAFDIFRRRQVEGDGSVPSADKLRVRERLTGLEDELNKALAGKYGINAEKNRGAYEKWLVSHQPFHWFIEYYGIMMSGGFDVIIGNPPYVELSNISKQYSIVNLKLISTGNIYSVCLERFIFLTKEKRWTGVIVPISSISTPRMKPLMEFIVGAYSLVFVSNFAVRPGKLFTGVDMNLTIIIGQKCSEGEGGQIFSTTYNRWNEIFRDNLFASLKYTNTIFENNLGSVGKISEPIELQLLSKIFMLKKLEQYRFGGSESDTLYCHSGGRYFRKCIREKLSNEYKELTVQKGFGNAVICLISSSFYYWLWIVLSDCYHVTKTDVNMVPVPCSIKTEKNVSELADKFLSSLYKHAKTIARNRADGTIQNEVNFDVGKSKPIMDEIDQVLARHYGFTEEEQDFIINYDIKYRMGLGSTLADEDS